MHAYVKGKEMVLQHTINWSKGNY